MMEHTHYRYTHDHPLASGQHTHGPHDDPGPVELSDANKLRLLADWFDQYDRTRGRSYRYPPDTGNEVQVDLRRIADELERGQ